MKSQFVFPCLASICFGLIACGPADNSPTPDVCTNDCEMDPTTGEMIGWKDCATGHFFQMKPLPYFRCHVIDAEPPYCQVGATKHPCVDDNWTWGDAETNCSSDATPGAACTYLPTGAVGSVVEQ